MQRVTFDIVGTAPFMFNKMNMDKKPQKVSDDEWEEQTWRARTHQNQFGIAVLPGQAIPIMLTAISKRLGIRTKGTATWAKHFKSGILADAQEFEFQGVKADTIQGKWIAVPTNGQSGFGKRVLKCFPHIPEGYRLSISLTVVDESITSEIMLQHLMEAGQVTGIGSWRPENGGTNGRFVIENYVWHK